MNKTILSFMTLTRHWLSTGAICLGLVSSLAVMESRAATLNITNRPLATQSVIQVSPNLMFILDDSGSMQFDYIPKAIQNNTTITTVITGTGTGTATAAIMSYGFLSPQCNGLSYDPSINYTPPSTGIGTATFAASIFNSAYEDGWNTGSLLWNLKPNTPKNLTGSYYYTYTGSQPKLAWSYNSTGLNTDTFAIECRAPETTAGAPFVKTPVTAAEAQNYANWFSYYRTRYTLMRTSVGRAMVGLDSTFRVGFSTITTPSVSGTKFLDVKTFDDPQKVAFYQLLYGATPQANTPLRGALSKAGRYYAKKATGQTYDPVQYSCQRNYALLTTDGYWDMGREQIPSSSPVVDGYGPYRLDNKTPVGDQDVAEALPMKDKNGAANTLADVAEYYYATDLRTQTLGNCILANGTDTCANTVRPIATDPAIWQHMNTFTIGFGVNGVLPYDKNYLLNPTTGSYGGLSAGSLTWAVPVESLGEGSNAANVDDLWHAAINGRGQYYAAGNASMLGDAIQNVVALLKQIDGAASAASTSSLELVAGTNNQVYRASYTTELWTGDLQAYAVNGADATISSIPNWSAQEKLDATPYASRKIYFNSSGKLMDFKWSNLSVTQQAYFTNICKVLGLPAVRPAQCASLDAPNLTVAQNGNNMVEYLRGMRSYESIVPTVSGGLSTTTMAIYRKRTHVLGDIVNGAPIQVGKPPFAYVDAGYEDFAAKQSSRKNVVYAAANDGMLHAFAADSTDGGTELWAYVPGSIMPDLYMLADSAYASKHQYNVDGAPVMADVKDTTGVWKTILVAGLNSGGRSYYALDVTDPLNPQALWEFTDTNLGLTFGNPIITKRADGTWIVAFTSGYNNTSTGDGDGHLFVLDANTGAKLLDIPTGVGKVANPSGLAKINNWIDDTTDNTTKRFYGGDLLGNLWRFDIDGLVVPKQSAMLLGTFQTSLGTPQPITTQPVLTAVSGKPVVAVGTGIYLTAPDVTSTAQQSIYAVQDSMTATGWGDVRANTASFVKQTLTLNSGSATASVTDVPVDWSVKAGWWIDFPHAGERVTSAPKLQFDTLAVASIIPSGAACTLGGESWKYYLDIANGGVVTTDVAGEMWSASSMIVGMNWVKDSDGKIRIISQGSNGEIKVDIPPIPSITGVGSARRTSWRELAD